MNTRARITGTTVLIFASLVYLFAWSSIFTVKEISFSGLPKSVSEDSVITKTKIVLGEKLARIEPRAIEKNIMEMSWVKSASVTRNWLTGGVEIKLSSRTPVGIFKGQALDSTGTLFDFPGGEPEGLPHVSAASPEAGLGAIALFTALPIDMRDQIISINASEQSSISSWQNFSGRKLKVTWGSAEQIDLKVSVFRALLALQENSAIKRVDLTAPHAPIVK